ncbi:hypothetical protein AOA80_02565 [Methanomassiliicoccales archaeon RumEn M1]|nr:hypothetical protein AOA80_02565 [Methanomassiliicoccales archaeon RumEn M1]
MIEAVANEEVKTKGYRRLNRKCMLSMYITNGIIYAILMAAFILLMIFVPSLREPGARPIVLLAAAAMVLLLLYFVIGPRIYYDRYRYMITADKVDVRYGIIILRHILVPIERVHQVEVSRGPVNNMLGLANVNITTAGGVATISYLEVDEAEKIVERLTEVINAMLRGGE